MTRNRQITIPSNLAKKIGIREGDYVEITLRNNELIIRKVKSLEDLAGSWKNVDTEKLSEIIRKRWKSWNSA